MPLITAEQIPQAWRQVLHVVQEVNPAAIIAGGALRDLDNECARDIKDLDIFAYESAKRDIQRKLTANGYTQTYCYQPSASEDTGLFIDGNDSFEGIIGGRGDDVLDINLIYVKNPIEPADYMKQFDFGICQIMFDGRQVLATRAYFHDKAFETFTLLRANSTRQFMDSMNRFNRLRKKYKDWTMTIPWSLELPSDLGSFGRHNANA